MRPVVARGGRRIQFEPVSPRGAQEAARLAKEKGVETAYLQTAASVGIFLVLLPAILEAQRARNPERPMSTMGVVLALILAARLTLIAPFPASASCRCRRESRVRLSQRNGMIKLAR